MSRLTSDLTIDSPLILRKYHEFVRCGRSANTTFYVKLLQQEKNLFELLFGREV